MPRKPGTRLEQEIVDDSIQTQESELPTCIIGPLYHVVEDEEVDGELDIFDNQPQEFEWPGRMLGTVIDLQGVDGGMVDTEDTDRSIEFKPRFRLTSSGSETYSFAINVDQDGFYIPDVSGQVSSFRRGSTEGTLLGVGGEQFIYNPSGGFGYVNSGDLFEFDGEGQTVLSSGSTRVFIEGDVTPDVLPDESISGVEKVDDMICQPDAPGRMRVSGISGTPFSETEEGDLVYLFRPISGLIKVEGSLSNGGQSVEISSPPSVEIPDLDSVGLRIVNNISDESHTRGLASDLVSSYDEESGVLTLSLSEDVGTDGDDVDVTIMEQHIGHVEMVDPTDQNIVVVSDVEFSDSDSFVYTVDDEHLTEFDFFPEISLEVSFRELRSDLSGELLSGQTREQILTSAEHDSLHYRDGIAFAANLTSLAQPEDALVYFIPVDLWPDEKSGLSEDIDILAGYQHALEEASTVDVIYNLVLSHRSPALRSAFESHISTMSTEDENAWRRGFWFDPVPKGDFESTTGVIAPGYEPGFQQMGESGNKVIKDDSIDFLTEAEVEEGTRVVVESPSLFSGEYRALGSTTDGALILDGENWPEEYYSTFPSLEISTSSPGEFIVTMPGGSPPGSGFEGSVHEGDYLRFEANGNDYSMVVTEVSGGSFYLSGPTDLDLTSELVEDAELIRTFSSVDYYIRPLSKEEKVDRLVDEKTLTDRRFTLTLDYSPTIEVGTDSNGNPVLEELSPALTLAAIAAKRSGSAPNEEITNLFLGGGIEDVPYAYKYFQNSQLRRLSDAGFTLLTKESRDAEPTIRDKITSDTENVTVQEEMVTANSDWQSKTLIKTYQRPPGTRFNNMSNRLMGVRTMQIDAILRSWVNNGFLNNYDIINVGQNEDNPRQTDIEYIAYLPVAEKEIRIVKQITV